MGPLIDRDAVKNMENALEEIKKQGGTILYGGQTLTLKEYEAGTYVVPCICEAWADMLIVSRETFAPILYPIRYKTIKEAIDYHNAVPQGLSSAIFTRDIREAGSDEWKAYMRRQTCTIN